MNIMEALKQMTITIKTWTEERIAAQRIANDLLILDGKLYLAQNGIPLTSSAVTLSDGDEGSVPDSDVILLTDNLPSTGISTLVGDNVILDFDYMSVQDKTGSGIAYVCVDGELKASLRIGPGNNKLNIGQYLVVGINTVKLTCMDKFKNYNNISYTVTVNTEE